MVSQPIHHGSGKPVMLDQQLSLEESFGQDDIVMSGQDVIVISSQQDVVMSSQHDVDISGQNDVVMTDAPAALTSNADSERRGQAPEVNWKSIEVAEILAAITAAYASGPLITEDVQGRLARQLQARWEAIREYDQAWGERSRNLNAPWMSSSDRVTSSEASDGPEIDRLRAVVGELDYLRFRRSEQALGLPRWLVDPDGCGSSCRAMAEGTLLKRRKLFRDLLDNLIDGLISIRP